MDNHNLELMSKKIESLGTALTNADQKIADYLLANPEQFISQTITQIAESVGTSIAGITRFVKKMGYDKLPDFKIALTKDLESNASIPYEDISSQDSITELSKKVIAHNIQGLMDLEGSLNEENLNVCLDILTQSKKISFVGFGGSVSVAQDAYLKFLRLGKTVELLSDVHMLTISASVEHPNHAIVVISHEGANTDLNAALKIAKKNGAQIIAITQFSQSPLTKISDVCLYTFAKGFNYKPEPLISRVTEYTIVDLLYVAFSIYSENNLQKNLKIISENLKQFKNYEI